MKAVTSMQISDIVLLSYKYQKEIKSCNFWCANFWFSDEL